MIQKKKREPFHDPEDSDDNTVRCCRHDVQDPSVRLPGGGGGEAAQGRHQGGGEEGGGGGGERGTAPGQGLVRHTRVHTQRLPLPHCLYHGHHNAR